MIVGAVRDEHLENRFGSSNRWALKSIVPLHDRCDVTIEGFVPLNERSSSFQISWLRGQSSAPTRLGCGGHETTNHLAHLTM